ncbi:hypothetical protein N665_0117s0027, partial [Sinapis alba]
PDLHGKTKHKENGSLVTKTNLGDLRSQLKRKTAILATDADSPSNCMDLRTTINKSKTRKTKGTSLKSQVENDHHITFSAIDTRGLHTLHNDPLLIDIGIGECQVTKFLVDTSSSVDLIFRDTLDKMGINSRDMKPSSRTLTGFSRASVQMIGIIHLLVYAGDVIKTVKFSVIHAKEPYNAILGTPWLHSTKAV